MCVHSMAMPLRALNVQPSFLCVRGAASLCRGVVCAVGFRGDALLDMCLRDVSFDPLDIKLAPWVLAKQCKRPLPEIMVGVVGDLLVE